MDLRDRVLAYLREQRALCDAATPDWFAWHTSKGWTIQTAVGWVFCASAKGTRADAIFASAARTLLPAALDCLIAEVERHKLADIDDGDEWCEFDGFVWPCHTIADAAKLVPEGWQPAIERRRPLP